MDIQVLASELQALGHPKRLIVLREFWHAGNQKLSPSDISKLTGIDLGVTSYHVRLLHRRKLIQQVSKVPRRGAVEHYYKLTDSGLRWAVRVLST